MSENESLENTGAAEPARRYADVGSDIAGSRSVSNHHLKDRRKSQHHRHRRHGGKGQPYKKSPMERNRVIMKRENIMALLWAIPILSVAIGGFVWFTVGVSTAMGPSDNSSDKLEKLGMWMTVVGLVVIIVALVIHWIVRFAAFVRNRRILARDPAHRRQHSRDKHHHRRRRRHGEHPATDPATESATDPATDITSGEPETANTGSGG